MSWNTLKAPSPPSAAKPPARISGVAEEDREVTEGQGLRMGSGGKSGGRRGGEKSILGAGAGR